MKINVKRLHRDAIIPRFATAGAACFDLHALVADGPMIPSLYPGCASTIRTGLAFEIPAGHVMLVFSRSGHGFKNDVRLSNCVGVIDSDYRGEVMVKLRNDQIETEDSTLLDIKHGDRIAQAMIVPLPAVELVEVDDLSSTARGQGGFGSTGA